MWQGTDMGPSYPEEMSTYSCQQGRICLPVPQRGTEDKHISTGTFLLTAFSMELQVNLTFILWQSSNQYPVAH